MVHDHHNMAEVDQLAQDREGAVRKVDEVVQEEVVAQEGKEEEHNNPPVAEVMVVVVVVVVAGHKDLAAAWEAAVQKDSLEVVVEEDVSETPFVFLGS